MSDDRYLPSDDVSDYFAYVRPVQLGRITPLINGRNSGGIGPDVDRTEALDEMEMAVANLTAGDAVYLSAWFFEPATVLTAGAYGAATTWGELFATKAEEGVAIRILINDFDPISGLDQWLERSSLQPLDAIISGLSAAAADNLQYVVSLHPAHIGALKSLLAGQGGRDINVASHHQKFMVVRRGEEMTAFCGGLDIESRKTPARWRYGALTGWHDLHVKLEGPITRDLEMEFVMRWNREKDDSRRAPLRGWSGLVTLAPTPLTAADDVPEKEISEMQMVRTISTDALLSPYSTERADIKEAYRRGIASATRFIYMENQYFRSAELADWIVQQGTANLNLVVIMVVVASAAADDGANAITEHGDFLQYDTFEKIYQGLGQDRVRLYTMKNRAVHSKFILVDDAWMCVGSANANVRSFELDSELNIHTADAAVVADFRQRLWAHNLGTDPAAVAAWRDDELIAQWDAVAALNRTLNDQDMEGEGVIPFDYTAVHGVEHMSVPDALADLDIAREGGLFAGEIPENSDTVRIG